MHQIELRPTYWASVSGGKDSLYMLFQIMKQPEKYPLDGVVYFDLEKDYPFIKEVIKEVRRICDTVGVRFINIKPSKSWEELYKEKGYPGRRYRWCNKDYKLDCARQLEKMMEAQGKRVISYIGFCADEYKRFRFELGSRGRKVTQIYPLAEMGIEEHYILEWARNYPGYNNFYNYAKRCGCIGCPCSSLKNDLYNRIYYPDLYYDYMEKARAKENEVKQQTGKDYSIWDGKPKYNTEYRMKRVEELINDKT